MIIAMRTILIALLVYSHIFPEGFFALLTHEDHLKGLFQLVR